MLLFACVLLGACGDGSTDVVQVPSLQRSVAETRVSRAGDGFSTLNVIPDSVARSMSVDEYAVWSRVSRLYYVRYDFLSSDYYMTHKDYVLRFMTQVCEAKEKANDGPSKLLLWWMDNPELKVTYPETRGGMHKLSPDTTEAVDPAPEFLGFTVVRNIKDDCSIHLSAVVKKIWNWGVGYSYELYSTSQELLPSGSSFNGTYGIGMSESGTSLKVLIKGWYTYRTFVSFFDEESYIPIEENSQS